MKALNPSTGNLEEVYVKALDGMPVGSQVEFTGDTIPTGWEEVNDYSTTEIDTGKKWIDGSNIYSKTIDCGALPNNTTKTVNANINNLNKALRIYGYSTNGSGAFLPLPYANPNTISVFLDSGSLKIQTTIDRSSFIETYITIEYTKTS